MRKIILISLGIFLVLGIVGAVLFFNNPKELISNKSLEPISYKDINSNSYKIIDTDYITFDIPNYATHYWMPEGLDRYELIIPNVSIKNNKDYVLKYTWYDDRYVDEIFQVHYDFKDNKLKKEDITFNSLSKYDKDCLMDLPNDLGKSNYNCLRTKDDSELSFQNMQIELGTLEGYEIKQERDEVCLRETDEKEDCFINVEYPVYSWKPYQDIVVKDLPNNFKSIDDVSTSVCGILNTENGVYVFSQNFSQNTSQQTANQFCLSVTANNITINLNGYTMNGTYTDPYSGIYSYANYTTIKNGFIRRFEDPIRLWYGHDSLVQNVSTYDNRGDGLDVYKSANNSYIDMNVFDNFDRGLQIYQDSNDNTFHNINLSNNTNAEIYYETNSYNGTFTNVTFGGELEESLNDNSDFYRKWYLRVYVNDTLGNIIENANVTIFNSSNAYQISYLTNVSGYSNVYEIKEYYVNRTKRYYQGLYNITVNKTGYTQNSSTFNATLSNNNIDFVLTMASTGDSINPDVSLEYPTTTSYTAVQTELNFSASDDVALDKCWYSLDGGVNNVTQSCTANITGLNSGEGSSTWRIYANDTSGNENSSDVTFYVDSTITNLTNILGIEYYKAGENTVEQIGGAGVIRGQSFTIGTTTANQKYHVYLVGLKIYRALAPGDCNVSIYQMSGGKPTGKALVTNSTFDCNVITNNSAGEWRNVTLPGVVLNESTQYAIELNVPSGDGTNYVRWLSDDTSPGYTGGNVTRSTDGGATWTTADADTIFVVYGEPIIVDTVFSENSFNLNTTTQETKAETFILNITTNGSVPTKANLIINKTIYSSSITKIAGNNYTFISNVDMINSFGIIDTFFNFTIAGIEKNSTIRQLNVQQTFFGLCNSSLSTLYLNLTFKNETTNSESVNAGLSSSWIYYLGSGVINKSLSYSNTTENPSYGFCTIPSDSSLNVIATINYYNSHSEQRVRTLTSSLLTNSTTNLVLYLLPTYLGSYSRYQAIKTTGNPIKNVLATVTTIIGGSTITSAIGLTDDSGLITFLLDPNRLYSYVFSKSGYPDNTFSLNPTSPDIYSVTMGSTVTVPNGTEILRNTSIDIFPANSTLQNNTLITFGLNVTTGSTVSLMSLNITNSSGSQLLYQSDTTSGFISGNLNTGNNTKLIGYFIIETSEETVAFTKVWTVGDFYEGDYSLSKQLKAFITYEFSDFIRTALILLTIIGLLIYMSSGETLDISEAKLAAILLAIWVFSYVGWLNTGVIVSSSVESVQELGALSNQYGMAILCSGFAAWAILRRIV